MINIRNIYEKIFLLLMMVTLGVSNVNGQTLKDYAKNYKEELAEKQRIEKEAYEKACNQGTLDALRYFVDKYPKSKYVKDVNSRIKTLELKIEKNAYQTACHTGTLDAFKTFLKKYPRSQYSKDIQNRIKDFDLWNVAKRSNTIQAYESYLRNSQFKTFSSEANAAINDLKAIVEWENIKSTNNLNIVQSYIRKYPKSSKITDARKKEHELKGVQFFNEGNLEDAYREFIEAGGKYSLAYENRLAYDKCQEHHEFSLLNSYTNEADLRAFMTRYPNSMYSDQVSNLMAICLAKNLTMYSGEYSYNSALSYAKDESTRNQVKAYYEARKREYSESKKRLRKIKRQRDGGVVNFGFEVFDLGLNTSQDEDLDVEYTMYYNMGLSLKFGNYKAPVQFEIGAKLGVSVYTLWYGSDYETKAAFHMPLYARLKIGLGGGTYSKWYIDGVGYYNAIKESLLESDYSASVVFGVAWRHWDWRMIYYKQDIPSEDTYSDYCFVGTSFIYYF